MNDETDPTGAGGVARVFALVLLLLGAFTMGASAATSTFDDDRSITTGLGAVPFVIAFFSVPAFVTSVLLAQGPDTTRHGRET